MTFPQQHLIRCTVTLVYKIDRFALLVCMYRYKVTKTFMTVYIMFIKAITRYISALELTKLT